MSIWCYFFPPPKVRAQLLIWEYIPSLSLYAINMHGEEEERGGTIAQLAKLIIQLSSLLLVRRSVWKANQSWNCGGDLHPLSELSHHDTEDRIKGKARFTYKKKKKSLFLTYLRRTPHRTRICPCTYLFAITLFTDSFQSVCIFLSFTRAL